MLSTTEALARYHEDGYVIVESLLTTGELEAIRAELAPLLAAGRTGRNDFEGLDSQRVYALLAKAPSVATIVEHPAVLALLDELLLPNYLLSANLAINLLPGETAQPWHVDDGFYPIPRPRPAVSVGTIWAIDEFTEANGATEVLPGSHRWVDESPRSDDPRRVVAVMPAGSVIVFSGQLWHRGGANRAGSARCCISPQYCEPWARQQENMMLAVGARAAEYSPRVQSLLGYSIHPPFMGHVNGQHPLRLIDPGYTPGGDRARAADLLEGRDDRPEFVEQSRR
jgi:ectoine hydroxylase-related dioxygenase (phytanoyl-CoA dioxygenase family)